MPQPVVSSRYLFLCSPPKIVFAFRPASRATSMKVTPRSGGVSAARADVPGNPSGNAAASTCSNLKTNAVRLRDLRKSRRENDNRAPEYDMLEFPPIFGGLKASCKFARSHQHRYEQSTSLTRTFPVADCNRVA